MTKSLAQAKISCALRHNTPPAAKLTYQPGDEVLVWREKVVENRICQWLGPYTVVTFDANAKIVAVRKDANSALERYNMVQVKPFLSPFEASTNILGTLHSALK